jgi:hypothetical protein
MVENYKVIIDNYHNFEIFPNEIYKKKQRANLYHYYFTTSANLYIHAEASERNLNHKFFYNLVFRWTFKTTSKIKFLNNLNSTLFTDTIYVPIVLPGHDVCPTTVWGSR